jgi:hypothetical protein
MVEYKPGTKPLQTVCKNLPLRKIVNTMQYSSAVVEMQGVAEIAEGRTRKTSAHNTALGRRVPREDTCILVSVERSAPPYEGDAQSV